MQQDYGQLTLDEMDQLEKQTLRVIVQALQEYSREAKVIFESTPVAGSDSKGRHAEVIVLAEDLVQYALEVAECYPINVRYAGFVDYKRVRWLPTSFGLFPQVLLVDAKASTENTRASLQQSQLPLDAEFLSSAKVPVTLPAGVLPPPSLTTRSGAQLLPVTTSAFVHFHYTDAPQAVVAPFRTLHAIYCLALPHPRLKPRYNPNPTTTFFGEGKESKRLNEKPRIRVYFSRLKGICPWRLQELHYRDASGYTSPVWRDLPAGASAPTETPFEFLGR